MDARFDRLACLDRQAMADVACKGVFTTAAQWQMLRATAVDVAGRAALLGYADDRFGAWTVCAQRQALEPVELALGGGRCGDAWVRMTLVQAHQVVGRWVARIPLEVV